MSKKEVKTNAMRMLDRAKVSYSYEEYECDDFTDGIQTADKLGYDHKLVYKTLVTTGKTGNHYVFVSKPRLILRKRQKLLVRNHWRCCI